MARTEADPETTAQEARRDAANLSVARLLGGGERGGLVRLLLLDLALPFLAVRVLEGMGVPMVPSFAAAALFPLASAARHWFARRRVEVVGIAVAATLLVGAATALLTNDVRFTVVKAAPAYGLFGVLCLLSLFGSRPLMFYVARYFSSQGDPAQRESWNARLALPSFASAMRLLTWVWGLAALAESALGIATGIVLPPHVALVAEPALAIATLAALLFWTVAFARRESRGEP